MSCGWSWLTRRACSVGTAWLESSLLGLRLDGLLAVDEEPVVVREMPGQAPVAVGLDNSLYVAVA
eukprot:12900965-Prorocentrum_lima.AAC.1